LRNSCYENRKRRSRRIPTDITPSRHPPKELPEMAKLKKLHMSSNLEDLEKMSIIPDLRSKGMKM